MFPERLGPSRGVSRTLWGGSIGVLKTLRGQLGAIWDSLMAFYIFFVRFEIFLRAKKPLGRRFWTHVEAQMGRF